jgi:hypothetical protein
MDSVVNRGVPSMVIGHMSDEIRRIGPQPTLAPKHQGSMTLPAKNKRWEVKASRREICP